MEAYSRPPQNKYKSLIQEIWYTHIDKEEDIPRQDMIIPRGYINLVFNFGDPYYWLREQIPQKLPPILLTGQLTGQTIIKYGNFVDQIGLVIKAAGFYPLFHRPDSLFKNIIIDGSHREWRLDPLYQELIKQPSYEERYKSIHTWLEQVTKGQEIPDKLNTILKDMDQLDQRGSIQDLALKHNYSQSGLERFFKKYVGMTPKEYLGIVQFKKTLGSYNSMDMVDFYYDQSHFTKVCHRYTGRAPKQLWEESQEITLRYLLNNADFLQSKEGEYE
ncbi:helix-turn-helix domain-containing protein [Spirochaeta cellobiosiphila]|uniref:helix-turn-helix domain-containing protein n=1 Tax=Spirochaeta cellobiosiphila TaxID=504483 RepID=UPI0003FFE6DA|nr:DUF6597 domain-containing transcriptional factor [Spirochaeta cellobiosiphila]